MSNKINYQQILGESKERLSSEKFHESEFLNNLFFTVECSDVPSFLAAYSFKSYNYTKIDFNFLLYSVGQNSLEKINEVLHDTDTAFCMVKILYRLADYIYKRDLYSKFFHAYYLVEKCYFLFEKTFLRKTQPNSFKVLKDLDDLLKDKLASFISKSYSKLLNANNDSIYELKNILENIIKNDYLKNDELEENEKNRENQIDTNMPLDNTDMLGNITKTPKSKEIKYYMVSKLSIEKVISFLSNSDLNKSNLYKIEEVLKNYLDDNSSSKNYPCIISNLNLIDFKDNWDVFLNRDSYYYEANTQDEILNVTNKLIDFKERNYLKNGIVQNIDYYIVLENDYNKLKEYFSIDYDIPRYYSNNTKKIEIEYKHVELVMFSKKFKLEKYCNLIGNKFIQINNSYSFDDFKTKISLIYLSALGLDYFKASSYLDTNIKLYICSKSDLNLFEVLLFFNSDKKDYYIQGIQELSKEIYSKLIINENTSNEDLANFMIFAEFENRSFLTLNNLNLCKNCGNNLGAITNKCSDCSQVNFFN